MVQPPPPRSSVGKGDDAEDAVGWGLGYGGGMEAGGGGWGRRGVGLQSVCMTESVSSRRLVGWNALVIELVLLKIPKEHAWITACSVTRSMLIPRLISVSQLGKLLPAGYQDAHPEADALMLLVSVDRLSERGGFTHPAPRWYTGARGLKPRFSADLGGIKAALQG